MKIRMKVTSAGPGGVMNAGWDYTVSDEQGGLLVAGGYATEVVEAPVEAAPVTTSTSGSEGVTVMLETATAEEATAEEATVEAPEDATAKPQRRRNPAKPKETRKG